MKGRLSYRKGANAPCPFSLVAYEHPRASMPGGVVLRGGGAGREELDSGRKYWSPRMYLSILKLWRNNKPFSIFLAFQDETRLPNVRGV